MMPPTNRLGGALQMASQIASIATGISSSAGLFDFGQKPSGFSFGDTAIGAGGGSVGGMGTGLMNYGFPTG